jgi:chromosome segregation ATPase
MEIKNILAKILKGEQLTDEEKAFVATYDPAKEKDGVAAAARKAAEKERDEARQKAEEAQAKLDKIKADAEALQKKQEEEKLTAEERFANSIKDLNAKLEEMNARAQKAEADRLALERKTTILAEAKKAGVIPIKGVSSSFFDSAILSVTAGVNADDAEALKQAFESFKSENAALISTESPGGVPPSGDPKKAGVDYTENPWKKESYNLTKQIEITEKDSALAARLKSEAGVN